MKCDVCGDECYNHTNVTLTFQKSGKVTAHSRRNMCMACAASMAVFLNNGPVKVISDGVKQERGVLEYMKEEGERCMRATNESEIAGSSTTEKS